MSRVRLKFETKKKKKKEKEKEREKYSKVERSNEEKIFIVKKTRLLSEEIDLKTRNNTGTRCTRFTMFKKLLEPAITVQNSFMQLTTSPRAFFVPLLKLLV